MDPQNPVLRKTSQWVGSLPGAPPKVFSNADALKAELHASIFKKEYRAEDHYKEVGFCQKLARNTRFEYITLFIIMMNAIWIGYDVDQNEADALPLAGAGFQVVENLFCVFFTIEIALRTFAFKSLTTAFKDVQLLFDLSLVVLMISETWVAYLIFWFSGGHSSGLGGTRSLSLLRMLRLSRMLTVS